MKTSLSFLLMFLVSPIAMAVERDEAKALQYIYCENINLFMVSLASKNNDVQMVRTAKTLRIHFRLGATMLSDGEFLLSHEDHAVQKVISQTNRERAGEDGLMIKEFQTCLATWDTETQELIGWKK